VPGQDDGIEQPPRRRLGGHRAEQSRLGPQRRQVRAGGAPVDRHHRQIHRQPTRLVTPLAAHQRRQRHRQVVLLPATLREIGRQASPGMRHQVLPVGHNRQRR
jgi:hypothetical protein